MTKSNWHRIKIMPEVSSDQLAEYLNGRWNKEVPSAPVEDTDGVTGGTDKVEPVQPTEPAKPEVPAEIVKEEGKYKLEKDRDGKYTITNNTEKEWTISIDELRKLLPEGVTLGKTIEVPLTSKDEASDKVDTESSKIGKRVYTYNEERYGYYDGDQLLVINEKYP